MKKRKKDDDIHFYSKREAQEVLDQCNLVIGDLNKKKKLAIILTLGFPVGFLIEFAMAFLARIPVLGIIAELISAIAGLVMGLLMLGLPIASVVLYFQTGCVKDIFKSVGRVAFWGWILVPFPLDLITVFITIWIAILEAFYLPALVIKDCTKGFEELKAEAERYLEYAD